MLYYYCYLFNTGPQKSHVTMFIDHLYYVYTTYLYLCYTVQLVSKKTSFLL